MGTRCLKSASESASKMALIMTCIHIPSAYMYATNLCIIYLGSGLSPMVAMWRQRREERLVDPTAAKCYLFLGVPNRDSIMMEAELAQMVMDGHMEVCV